MQRDWGKYHSLRLGVLAEDIEEVKGFETQARGAGEHSIHGRGFAYVGT